MNARYSQCYCTHVAMHHGGRGEVNVHMVGCLRSFEVRRARFTYLGVERGEGFIDPVDGGSSEVKLFLRVVPAPLPDLSFNP